MPLDVFQEPYPKRRSHGQPDDRAPIRFFARIRSLDLACPKCDRVVVISRGGHTCWDQRTSRFQCWCGIRLTLGVIAYLGNRRRVPPTDTVPNIREAAEIRRDGLYLDARIPYRGLIRANKIVLEGEEQGDRPRGRPPRELEEVSRVDLGWTPLQPKIRLGGKGIVARNQVGRHEGQHATCSTCRLMRREGTLMRELVKIRRELDELGRAGDGPGDPIGVGGGSVAGGAAGGAENRSEDEEGGGGSVPPPPSLEG